MTPSPFHGIFSAFNQEHGISTAESVPTTLNLAEHAQIEEQADEPSVPIQSGQISVDIYEQDNYFIIRAPIAGVKLSDLDIEVDGRVLTIRGNRSLGDDIPESQYYVQECFWGEFSRSITMPSAIDPKKVRATFSKDCILKILIPKEEKVKIIRINESN